MVSYVDNAEGNRALIYINGYPQYEAEHSTYSLGSSGVVKSTGGRVWIMEASAGDKIEIRADEMDYDYYRIIFCTEFIPKM